MKKGFYIYRKGQKSDEKPLFVPLRENVLAYLNSQDANYITVACEQTGKEILEGNEAKNGL